MSDIVEVLNEIVERHDCSHPAIVSKASAEITRLTAEVERLKRQVAEWVDAGGEAHSVIERQMEDRAKLRAALEAALENGVWVSYSCDEDDCGNYVCCGEVSYKPHRPDCWTLKARIALSGDKHE